jgi:hypothetical protein
VRFLRHSPAGLCLKRAGEIHLAGILSLTYILGKANNVFLTSDEFVPPKAGKLLDSISRGSSERCLMATGRRSRILCLFKLEIHKRNNAMFRKIVILIVMWMPALGAAAHDLSLPELLALGCIPALAVSLILIQGRSQDRS